MKFNDKELAEGLCKKNTSIGSLFLENHQDDLYLAVVKNLHPILYQGEEELFKLNLQGKDYIITDTIQEAFLWLFERIQKISCSFKGKAPLIFYIRSIIFGDRIRVDYIRKTKGSVQYTPKSIKKLGPTVSKIYKLLIEKKTKTDIIRILNIDNDTYFNASIEIEKFLAKSGKLDKIFQKTSYHSFDFNEVSLDIEVDGEIIHNEVEDTYQQQLDESFILNEQVLRIDNIIKSFFNKYEIDIAIAYWGKGLTSKQIFTFFSDENLSHLSYLKINKHQDIFSVIQKIISKFKTQFKSEDTVYDKKDISLILENFFLYYFQKNNILSSNIIN